MIIQMARDFTILKIIGMLFCFSARKCLGAAEFVITISGTFAPHLPYVEK